MKAGWLSDWVVRLLHLTFLATTSYATSYCMDKSVIVWDIVSSRTSFLLELDNMIQSIRRMGDRILYVLDGIIAFEMFICILLVVSFIPM